jgi:putative transcriptional regulator
MESLQGQLLIASPSLQDPNFAKTVVLIAVHGDDGALGLVLNRETETPISEVWQQVSETPCEREGVVRSGGPVAGSLMVVHDQQSFANIRVGDELYVATELGAMLELASSDKGRAVFYVGHAGWGPGQLESEMREGSWLLLPASPDHVYSSTDALSLWRSAVNEVGRRQIQSLLPPESAPEDPQLN